MFRYGVTCWVGLRLPSRKGSAPRHQGVVAMRPAVAALLCLLLSTAGRAPCLADAQANTQEDRTASLRRLLAKLPRVDIGAGVATDDRGGFRLTSAWETTAVPASQIL